MNFLISTERNGEEVRKWLAVIREKARGSENLMEPKL